MKIKEGGGMDIEKEREAFEAWHYEQYLLENPNIDTSSARYIYNYAHKNALVCQLKESHFTAWQAAKAQAVPDLGELQERIAGHQYYHDEHGHMVVDMDDVVKEISSFDSWKAQAVPEGFVLIKDDTKTVVAIERMVEQQVEASGMDSRRLERLDGWKIIEAAVKAQEPAND